MLENIILYTGNSLLFLLYLAAVVFLFLKEESKPKRIFFVYLPLLLLALFCMPFFSALLEKAIGEEGSYRLLWLLPVSLTLSYTGVVLVLGCKRKNHRVAVAVALLLLFMGNGSLVYNSVYFYEAQNQYHMPQFVVDVCDVMHVEGRGVMAALPSEFLQFVRQYDPTICSPYGREMLVSRWGYSNALYDAMEAAVIDAQTLAELAKENSCHFVVLAKTREINGSLLDYGFVIYAEVDGYVIYNDPSVYMGLFDDL